MTTAKIDSLLGDLQKQFGADAVLRASDIPINPPISSGSLALDYAIGIGGLPSDRLVEISGKEGTGKTTLALTAMCNALRDNPTRHALFLDLEHKIDKEWMTRIVGQDFMDNRIIYIQPPTIERATNIYARAVESGQVCMCVLDSIGGAPTMRRNEDYEVSGFAGNSIGVGEFARVSGTLSATQRCLTIGVNQTRDSMNSRGLDLWKTPGGRAWGYHCTVRIEVVRGKDNATITMPGEQKPVPIGYTVYAKVRKNGVGAPGRVAYYWFYNVDTPEHGFGIDQLDEMSRLAIMTKTVEQKGGWYYHPALTGGKTQGLQKLQDQFRDDEVIRQTIISEVLASLKDTPEVAPMTDPEAPLDPEKIGDYDATIQITSIQDLWIKGENV